ncbi:MAG: tRNA (adenosine(37)-N6)-threonylcarbamoyltransferase complex ATPase subunit type 1 TsaE [Rhodocyclaceae bacterium]|nr:tRNA (adenosine(37)-N6)-threonylcarbamoyltransferase complex ATPase subunit type 1 TsaE [Rhodocyclaceae bacterium]
MNDFEHLDPAPMILDGEAATLALGARLAAVLEAPLVVWLCGDLGAGKTTFVRGVLRGLGFAEKVKSPTYTLVELYAISRLTFHHFDFYRFSYPEEFTEAGLDEYFAANAVCFVEWPDKALPFVPAPDLRIDLEIAGAARVARLSAGSERGAQCLTKMFLPAG